MSKTEPKLALIAGGFAKHLRKHPLPDTEIEAWVGYMLKVLHGVLDPATLGTDGTFPALPITEEAAS